LIGRHFFAPTLKLILFPMFLIIGGIVAANISDDPTDHSEYLLAGFGLGELTVSILSLSVLHAFNRNIKSKLEEEYYSGDQMGMQKTMY